MKTFSRGIAICLISIAAFCGICGLGATFNQIPWLLIAGGACLLLIIGTAIWYMGYTSRKEVKTEKPVLEKAVPAKKQVYDQAKEKPGIYDQDNP